MARHGENIRKRSDGRWEGRYKAFNEGRGESMYLSVYGRSYEEVKEKICRVKFRLAQSQAKTDGGGNGSKRACVQTVLFSQVAAEWLAEIADKRKYSTYVKYETIYRTHLDEAVGSCRLCADESAKLKRKISGCVFAELSESLQKSIVCVANQIISFANASYLSGIQPLERLSSKSRKKAVVVFSRSEQAKMLACIYGQMDRYMAVILLALHAGLRLGELCALRWTDVDFAGMTITVNRTAQRIAAPGHKTKTILRETDPKSESSKRTIPLAPEFVELFSIFKGNGPYVFGGEKMLNPRTMQDRFRKILVEADVERKNFHALRHTFATNCMENGVDAKALSEFLGHADVRITLNRYVHPTMDVKRKQIAALSDFYGQICGQICGQQV